MTAPDPVAFSILGIDIRWYGILIGIGFLLAIFITYRRAPGFGISSEHILDFAIWLIPFSIVGARIYYIIFRWSEYAGNLKDILNTRGGGLAIHGGIIAGLIVALLVCRHYRMDFGDMADLTFPQVALAQAIGRWGNFFNSEAHGGPTDLPWGIMVDGVKVHPTFLYESLWCFALFLFLLYVSKKRRFKYRIFLLYVMLYSLERFFVEWLRTDSLMIGSLRQAQVLSACAFAAGIVLYVILSKRSKKENKAGRDDII